LYLSPNEVPLQLERTQTGGKYQMTRTSTLRLLTACAALLTLTLATWAALNRGTIRGTVSDPQGALVPNVKITIINTNTGVEQSTVTNSAGFYLISELVPGSYTVHVSATGFVPMDFDAVAVKADDIATVDVQLKLGTQAQAVSVMATNPLVDTDPSNSKTYIDQQLVEDVPVVGRDIQGLIAMMPGFTQAAGPPGSLVGFNSQFSGFPDPTHILGSGVVANGSQPGANIWYLDGNMNAAQGLDNVVVNPAPDAVAEFQAITNNMAAEYGRTSGAIFNVILKSGTNSFHGSLYEYNRNSYLEATNPFAARQSNGEPVPPTYINSNQFGGTFGGPILLPKIYNGKNRTFFFASWDVSLLDGRKQAVYTVPTLLERQGNFSQIPSVAQYGLYDPLSTTYNAQTGTFVRQPFLNNNGTYATSIPASRIDPTAQYLLNQYPAPNYLDPTQQNAATGGCLSTCNNYLSHYGSSQNANNVTIKGDHAINDKNKLFVEWLYDPTTYSLSSLPWTGPTAPLAGLNGSFPFRVTNIVAGLGDTIVASPTLINDFRFSYSRQGDVPQPIPESLVGTQDTLQHIQGLNLPVYPPLEPTPIFNIGGLNSFGGAFNNLIQVTEAYTLTDNITKVLSRHTIKTGFMYRLDQTGTSIPTDDTLSFGGSLVDNPTTGQGGDGIAQFLLGAVDQGSSTRAFFPTFSSTHDWAAYIQDDFRITSKLTLNYGLRWDRFGWFSDRFGNSSYFDFNIPNPGDPTRMGGIVYVNTPQHPSNVLFPAHNKDFAPRFNFAYAATPKTVIRGGIDFMYTDELTQVFGQGEGPSEAPGYNVYSSWEGDATGQGLNHTGYVPAFILSNGAPSLPPFQNPKAVNAQLLNGQQGLLSQIPAPHDPYVILWNLTIQRELPGNMALSVGAIGNEGHFLLGQNNRSYDYVPVNTILQYRSALNTLVPMPPDLVPIWGSQYFLSQLMKPYPQYSNVANFLSNDLNSVYDGLQVKVTKRLSHGLNFQSSYAWQKTIASPGLGAYLSNTWTGGPSFGSGRGEVGQLPGLLGVGNGSSQDPDDRSLDRSVAAFDVPSTFNFSWTYELPTGKSLTGDRGRVVAGLFGGWKLSGTFTAQSGLPDQITGPCNALSCRVNVVGNPNAGRGSESQYQTEQQWWNPNAFTAVFGSSPSIIAIATNGTPAEKDQYNQFYQFGDAGYLLPYARTPGFWGSDMSLNKEFNITERVNMRFRLDAFNAFNHQNLGLPNATWCLPPTSDGSVNAVNQFGCQFGKITNVATDPRALQIGLKLRF
jgi:hypothetical protein